jgi:predicted GNAT family acetyltransferase
MLAQPGPPTGTGAPQAPLPTVSSGCLRSDVHWGTMADPPPTIEVTDNADRQRYEARVDGMLAGYATYDFVPGGIVFLHTRTEPAFAGHGVGTHLAQFALDDARRRGLSVIARCPFIADYIDGHPDYQDLVVSTP